VFIGRPTLVALLRELQENDERRRIRRDVNELKYAALTPILGGRSCGGGITSTRQGSSAADTLDEVGVLDVVGASDVISWPINASPNKTTAPHTRVIPLLRFFVAGGLTLTAGATFAISSRPQCLQTTAAS
jgi:hypothetical protein